MSSGISESVASALWYAATSRHLLEGQYSFAAGLYRNWDRSFVRRPARYHEPTSLRELQSTVANAHHVGAVGAGHSFNALHLDRPTLISLDQYKGMLHLDLTQKSATFCAGSRLREVTRILHEHRLALPVLPDHNAQSLAGVLATDVHASGEQAHISEAVLELKLVDAHGKVHVTRRGEPLFRATIGGMGCTGIIVEVTLQCVDAFRLKTHAFRCSWGELMSRLDELALENERLAVGYLPAIDACIVEVKNRTYEPASRFGSKRETARHVSEAIAQAVALPMTTSTAWPLRELGRLMLSLPSGTMRRRAQLVLESHEGYNRNVYQVQKQVEFTCLRSELKTVLDRGYALFRRRPRQHYYLLGLRLARGHSETLVGPGALRDGDPSGELAWVAPVLFGRSIVDQADEAEWRAIIESVSGRPHYGKHLVGLGPEYFARVHGSNWTRFLEIVRTMDPNGKFANALVAETAHMIGANGKQPRASSGAPAAE